jgi:hypothetical protein
MNNLSAIVSLFLLAEYSGPGWIRQHLLLCNYYCWDQITRWKGYIITDIATLVQVSKQLSGKVLVETARYQLAKEAFVKVISNLQSYFF